MNEPKKRSKRGGGQLIWVGKSWSARYWGTVDGERVRRCVSLGTGSGRFGSRGEAEFCP